MPTTPPQTTLFILFRHGQTDWNKEERFQGHINIPLNETGRTQARALIEPLRPLGLQAILSSDLDRAKETGQIVASALNLPFFETPHLREANLGKAQGMTRTEIEKEFGEELAQKWRSWKVTDADIFYPGGETGRSVYERTYQALAHFAQTQAYRTVGVATHGGVIRRMLQPLLPEGSPPVPIPNGVIYKLQYTRTGHGSSQWKLLTPISADPTNDSGNPAHNPSFG